MVPDSVLDKIFHDLTTLTIGNCFDGFLKDLPLEFLRTLEGPPYLKIF